MIRIDVTGGTAARSSALVAAAEDLGLGSIGDVSISAVYFLAEERDPDELARLITFLADPITQQARWAHVDGRVATDAAVIEVAPRPGVTDIAARELARAMTQLGIEPSATATATRYVVGGSPEPEELDRLARVLLANETVETHVLGRFVPDLSVAPATAGGTVETVPLADLDEDALVALSRERLLSLDGVEMAAIQRFFADAGRAPTDAELETLAQTWSEHCVHKTFRALVDYTRTSHDGQIVEREQIDGLLDTYLRAVTDELAPVWLRSAFVDNAGIVAFDDEFDLAIKAETHNHPSTLEPFGGANTGVGGVVDIIGVSARPIAATDVLCFGPQDLEPADVPEGVLHPRRIASGVIAGIGDYGNKLGLPTVNGAVIYDPGYVGNPLVFCGSVGILPTGSHPTEPRIGDLIVALGGRTGHDGIHGTTFSSAELAHDTSVTAGSAVQIGDPITEKGLIEVVELARDAGLYTAITDCGAGGFSSAVGEMGERLGADVDLAAAPLKYPGLEPWEIWLSEAQERMVLAVPESNLDTFRDLCRTWEVELSVLGSFTGTADLVVRHGSTTVVELPMSFLHDGIPRKTMSGAWTDPAPGSIPRPDDATATLLAMLAHPNVASKEDIIRTYDHEVRGGTLARPLTGPEADGPGDAAVLKPLRTWHHDRAFAISCGVNPLLGKHDPYAMAVSAIDEAFRNAVAVGADPDQVALLDNFCWGNPTLADRLGGLVRAAQGCRDGALAFSAPFVSGKDSLYNEFEGRPIPPTLLITALAIVPDIAAVVTSDLKAAGNHLVLVGETRDELGGSLFASLGGATGGHAPTLVDGALERYRRVHRAMRKGLVQACHDCSEGGLAVAAAEMCIAGRLGLRLDAAPDAGLDAGAWLFSETNGRLLCEVRPADLDLFMAEVGSAARAIGVVTENAELSIDASALRIDLAELLAAWKRES